MTYSYYPPYSPPPRRRTSPWLVVGLVAVGVVVLCCGAGIVSYAFRTAFGDDGAVDVAAPASVPAYEVLSREGSTVELLMPGASVADANAAIRDYVDRTADGEDYLVVQVVRSADAGVIVCRAEHVADQRTATVRTGGRVTGPFPALSMSCPDPAGQ